MFEVKSCIAENCKTGKVFAGTILMLFSFLIGSYIKDYIKLY